MKKLFGIDFLSKKEKIMKSCNGNIKALIEELPRYIDYCKKRKTEVDIKEFEDIILKSENIDYILLLSNISYANKSRIENILFMKMNMQELFSYFTSTRNTRSSKFEDMLLSSNEYSLIIEYMNWFKIKDNDDSFKFINKIKESNDAYSIYRCSEYFISIGLDCDQYKLKKLVLMTKSIEYILYYSLYIDSREFNNYFESNEKALALLYQKKELFLNKKLYEQTYNIILERIKNKNIIDFNLAISKVQSSMRENWDLTYLRIQNDLNMLPSLEKVLNLSND